MTSPLHANIEEILSQSAFVHSHANDLLKQDDDDKEQETVRISKDSLRKIRRAAVKINKSISKHAKLSFQREDRLVIEVHQLKRCLIGENIDREAYKAAVFERLRLQTADRNGINALDKAIASVARTDAAITALSAVGPQKIHGTPIVAKLNDAIGHSL
jgi:hypothetical protein